MKVALVQLPFWPTYMPPLGLAYISAVLKRRGHEVTCTDLNMECWYLMKKEAGNPWDGFLVDRASNIKYFKEVLMPLVREPLSLYAKKVAMGGYDAIGLSINELNVHASRFVIQLIRTLNPEIKIFVGGPEVYREQNELLDDIYNGIIDVAVIGEGEEIVDDVFEAWENDGDIDQIIGVITSNKESNYEKAKKRPAIDFSKLPYPDFSDFKFDKYIHQQIPIMMSRGCVAACSFCTEFVTWRSYRIRTAEHVFEEMRKLKNDTGISSFYFCDSLINGNHEMLSTLVDLILDNNFECDWVAFCRADDRLTKELLDRMRKSGCEELFFGFETGSDKMLGLMNKNNTVATAYRTTKDAFDAGIKVHGLFIIAFPGETEEDFFLTQKFIYDNKDYLFKTTIGGTLQLPSMAPMAQRPQKYDIKLNDDGSVYFDEYGKWHGKNGFGPEVREKRLKDMQDFLDSLGITWDPVPYERTRQSGLKNFIESFAIKKQYKLFQKRLKDRI